MRDITWNDQRNNKSHFDNAGTFLAWNQCFTSDAIMFMSFYCSLIRGDDDEFLAKYLFDVEDSLNKNGIGAEVRERMHLDPTTHSSYFFAVQAAAITKYLNERGIKGKAVVQEGFPINDLPFLVTQKPVIVGTHNLGGLPDGHMLLLVDFDHEKKAFKVNDSFGDANTAYKITNGYGVMYDFEKIYHRLEIKGLPGKCNILSFDQEA